MKFVNIALVALLALSATSAFADRKPLEQLGDFTIKVDPNLGFREKRYLKAAIEESTGYQPAAPMSYLYTKFFGGGQFGDAMKFVDARVDYVLSRHTNLDRLFVVADAPESTSLDEANTAAIGKAYTMASNPSVPLQFLIEDILTQPQFAGKVFRMNFGRRYEAPVYNPSNSKTMMLGKGFIKRKFSTFDKLSTLVHEARHSDCPNGISDADKKAMVKGEETSDRTCGMMHVKCPAGHDYADLYACDDMMEPGAYFVEAVYDNQVQLNCANCTEVQKQSAKMSSLDNLSRVVNLDALIEKLKRDARQ